MGVIKTSTHVVCLSAVVALGAPFALAQGMGGGNSAQGNMAGATQGNMGKGSLSAGDKTFMMKAMQGNLAEIQLGKMALEKTSNPQVKQFAQKIVDDHTNLDSQAKPVAQELGITPPTQVSTKDQMLMTKLQGLTGTQFDKEYVKAMVADHKEDDKEFKKEETSGKNQSVKDLATQGEPIIAQHLQMAENLEKSKV
jgi:putative membrane protein